MSDIVTFTEKDFYPAVHTAFEYILTTGRLKTDCRTDTDFDKKWHLEPVSRQEKKSGFFQYCRTNTKNPYFVSHCFHENNVGFFLCEEWVASC